MFYIPITFQDRKKHIYKLPYVMEFFEDKSSAYSNE